MNNNFRLAILASGKGITGEAIFDLASLVIVSNSKAGIIQRIKDFNEKGNNLKYMVLERSKFKDRFEFGEALLKILEEHNINFISQNGWTVYTPENVLKEFEGRIINAHPGPLDSGYPDFGGKGMNDLAIHKAVIYFINHIERPFKTELTLHMVTSEFDKGELVGIREVEVFKNDTPEILQERVKEEEKKFFHEFWSKVKMDGKIIPIKRENRVILPKEEKILEEAKKKAIQEYAKKA